MGRDPRRRMLLASDRLCTEFWAIIARHEKQHNYVIEAWETFPRFEYLKQLCKHISLDIRLFRCSDRPLFKRSFSKLRLIVHIIETEVDLWGGGKSAPYLKQYQWLKHTFNSADGNKSNKRASSICDQSILPLHLNME